MADPSPSGVQEPEDLKKSVLDSIRRIVRFLRLASRQVERELGVSAAQLFVLQQAAEHPGSALNDLADHTLTDQSSVSVVVSRLVTHGLLKRVKSKKDARRAEISLTPAGRRLLLGAPEPAQLKLLLTLDRMADTDLVCLARGMSWMVELLGESGGESPLLFEDDSIPAPRRPRTKKQK